MDKKTFSYLDLRHDKNHTIIVKTEDYKVIFDGEPGDLIGIIKLGKVYYDEFKLNLKKARDELENSKT